MMNKFSTKAMTDTLAYTGGAIVGSASSRILYDKIPLKDEKEGETTKSKIKRGLLIAAGIVSATMVDGKQTAGKVIQGAGMGMAATQTNELVKELLKPEGIFKVALGSPNTETVFIETYPSDMLDMSSFDNSNANNPFLANPTLQASEIFSAT